MTFGLKLFWIMLFVLVAGGLIYLATYGIPTPGVDVHHPIDLETRFK